MKAIRYTKFGPPDVLQLQEVDKPSPGDNEVLVRVHASSINAFEWRRFTMPRLLVRIFSRRLRHPKDGSIGVDIAGRVEAVGRSVTQFQAGDEVFGVRRGAFSEYVCAPENLLALKPANLSFEQAASVPLAAWTALQGLRDKGKIQPGQKVLIYGAGGGVGHFAVQIAKSFRAEVTAVCGTRNVDMVRSIGADHVLDYTRDDFSRNGQRYDLILAANGYRSIFEYRRALKPNGTYVVVGGFAGQIVQGMLIAPLLSMFGKKKMLGMMTRPNQEDLVFMKDLIEEGKVVPVIDRCYPLSEVAEAMKYAIEGHIRGKIVIANPS
jgi:NADPH:quinone reductase-like Zn-dependent oxidoreductase